MNERWSTALPFAAICGVLSFVTALVMGLIIRSVSIWESVPVGIGVWFGVYALTGVVLHYAAGWSWGLILRGRESSER
jgi:hypothetical protein